MTGYSSQVDSKSLPAIVPVKIDGEKFWADLDKGAGRDFISKDAAKKLKMTSVRYDTRQIMTINGTKKQ